MQTDTGIGGGGIATPGPRGPELVDSRPLGPVELRHAALCLDCESVFDGDQARGVCPKCASEALLWLEPVLNRPGARA